MMPKPPRLQDQAPVGLEGMVSLRDGLCVELLFDNEGEVTRLRAGSTVRVSAVEVRRRRRRVWRNGRGIVDKMMYGFLLD